MPPKGRGRGGAGHKGQRRHFTNPEEVAAQQEKEEKERQWRRQRNEGGDDEDEEDENGEKKANKDSSEDSSSEESSGEEEPEEAKAKGVEGLIEIENPNRVVQKPRKVATVTEQDAAPQLSRREREEVERQRSKAHYEKMHAAGLTEQARADLARLAIIKKQREDQARKKAEEKRIADEKAAAAASGKK